MNVREVAVEGVTAAAPAAGGTPPTAAWPAGDVPGDAVPQRAADHGKTRARARWWQARRARFGLGGGGAPSKLLPVPPAASAAYKRRSV
jgi:hypothetical protein